LHKYYLSETSAAALAAFAALRFCASALLALRRAAYQVTVKMDDEKTRKREIEGLQEAMEIYDLSEGYIITLNEKEELTVDGKTVHIIPAWEWMLK
jgi:predicted AAA+ superfamily ATPase